MRLDEHGRWVSDDGAYVWDEAAQTWHSASPTPPAGSGGATAWPNSAAAGTAQAGPANAGPLARSGGAVPETGVPRAVSTTQDRGREGAGVGEPGGAGAGSVPVPGVRGLGTGALPSFDGTGQFGRWAPTGAQETVRSPGEAGVETSARSERTGVTPTGPGPAGSAPLGTDPLGTGPLGTDPLGTDPLGLVARADPLRTGAIPVGNAPGSGPAHDRLGEPAQSGVEGVAAGGRGLAPADDDWGDDGESTGEIRRFGGPAAPARATGVAHWEDDADDPDGEYEDDDLPDDDPDGYGHPGERGWSPSSGRLSTRAVRPERETAEPAGGLRGALGRARERPAVLIAAVVVLVCAGLGLAGFLALGGGSDGGSASGATAASKGRYDKSVRDAYLSSCLDVSNGNEGYCTCTLDKLQASYTQEEYQRFSAQVQSDSSQRIVREIYAACRDKR